VQKYDRYLKHKQNDLTRFFEAWKIHLEHTFQQKLVSAFNSHTS